MIRGLGLDLARVSRVEQTWRRFGARFLERCFTPAESAACLARPRSAQALAMRFAAKEAFAKAAGLGLRGLAFTDIEVINDALGKPSLALHGPALDWAREQGVSAWHLSLSDDGDYAAAVVVLEGD